MVSVIGREVRAVVAGLSDPEQAERILAEGKADMVAMTRAQIADPFWATKVRGGRGDEIYRCVRGKQGCISRSFRGLPIACTGDVAAAPDDHASPARVAGGPPVLNNVSVAGVAMVVWLTRWRSSAVVGMRPRRWFDYLTSGLYAYLGLLGPVIGAQVDDTRRVVFRPLPVPWASTLTASSTPVRGGCRR